MRSAPCMPSMITACHLYAIAACSHSWGISSRSPRPRHCSPAGLAIADVSTAHARLWPAASLHSDLSSATAKTHACMRGPQRAACGRRGRASGGRAHTATAPGGHQPRCVSSGVPSDCSKHRDVLGMCVGVKFSRSCHSDPTEGRSGHLLIYI